MSECNSLSTEQVCFTVTATGAKVQLVAHYEYGLNAAGATILKATRYALPNGVPFDTAVAGAGAGTVRAGACALPASPNNIANCGDVGRNLLAFGANALTNGDMERSIGINGTSVAGPGWTSAGAVGVRWGFWQGTANPFVAVPSLGTRSMWVDVGTNLTESIIEWADIYLVNGQTYALEADALIINAPFALRVAVDGVTVTPMTAPGANRVWEKTASTFVFTGVSGYHRVGVFSNTGIGGGNDHGLDNFSLRLVASVAEPEVLTPTPVSDRVSAVIEGVAKTAGCNDERRDSILADMSKSLAANSAAATTLTTMISGPMAICVTNAGVSTTQHMRQVYSVNGNTGVDTLLRTEYSANGTAWAVAVPAGVIAMGQCAVSVVRNIGGREVTGVALQTLAAGTTSLTITAQTGSFDVSFDAGGTFPLLGITGSRSWSSGGTFLNLANVRVRGNTATSTYDMVWETV